MSSNDQEVALGLIVVDIHRLGGGVAKRYLVSVEIHTHDTNLGQQVGPNDHVKGPLLGVRVDRASSDIKLVGVHTVAHHHHTFDEPS
jgi:hypothetical protein